MPPAADALGLEGATIAPTLGRPAALPGLVHPAAKVASIWNFRFQERIRCPQLAHSCRGEYEVGAKRNLGLRLCFRLCAALAQAWLYPSK
jgi:hypothetical protein